MWVLFWQGKSFGGAFNNERWLDIRHPRIKTIMSKRFNYAKKVGCDGIEPDNSAAYEVRVLPPAWLLKSADLLEFCTACAQ